MRLYDWNIMQQHHVIKRNVVPNLAMEHGMMGLIEGRTNAGHLGQSILMGKDDVIWVGEPMSEQGECFAGQPMYESAHLLH